MALSASIISIAIQLASSTSSLEKAELLYRNNLLREAKVELISVSTDRASSQLEKAKALLLLGTISEQEGNAALARRTWEDVTKKFPESEQAADAKLRISTAEKAISSTKSENSDGSRLVSLPASNLKVLKAGGEPRMVVRFFATEGLSQQSILRTRIALTKTCEIKSHLRPESPNPNEELKIGVSVDSLRTISRDAFSYRQKISVPKDTASGSDASVTLSGQTVMQTDGRITSIEWDGQPSKAGSGAMQVSGGIEFPSDPIGVGAIWSVPFSWEAEGMALRGRNTYTLRSIEKNVLTLSSVINIPGGEISGTEGGVAFVAATGRSAVVVYPGSPLPVSAFTDLGISIRRADGTSSQKRTDSGCFKMQMMVGDNPFPSNWP